MERFAAVLIVAALILSGCSSSMSDSTPTGADGAVCVEPPKAEHEVDSPLNLAVEPNPVVAGSEAILSIEQDGLPSDAYTGVGAVWQCWNGSAWVDTHQIVKGFDGRSGQAIEVEPGAVTSIPSLDLPIPGSYPIVVPDVPPGTYRIIDRALGDEASVAGFVLVAVVKGRT